KTFICQDCAKVFCQGDYLKSHCWLHTDKVRYVCDVCKKSFTKSYNLKVHHKIHSGEKPFQCPKCGKCFLQNIQLNIHQTTHEECARGWLVLERQAYDPTRKGPQV
ncbi:unnamed protein product, partial [Staurois parvus]